jgi:hypothetical protein
MLLLAGHTRLYEVLHLESNVGYWGGSTDMRVVSDVVGINLKIRDVRGRITTNQVIIGTKIGHTTFTSGV